MMSWSKIKSVVVKVTALILGLLVFTIFINLSWFDEELHPTLQTLSEPQPISLEDNAYPLLWGLAAADDKDPLVVGKAIIARQRGLYEQRKKIEITTDELSAYYGGENLDAEWQALYKSLSCNSRQGASCAQMWLADVELKGVSNERLQLSFHRYQQIVSQPNFRENQEGDVFSPLPPYGLLLDVSRLYLTDQALTANWDEFFQSFKNDMTFWKTMLREGDYLIAKMVALAGIRNNIQILSTLIRNDRFNIPELNQLRDIVQPFTEEERNISETFLAEMRLNLFSWKSQNLPYGDPSWLTRLFMQKNASLNESYLMLTLPVQMLATLSATEFYQQKGFEKQAYSVRVFPPTLYNVGGKLLLKETLASYSLQDYITRVHDVNGQISVVQLQLEIALNPGVNPQTVIQQSPHRNPYTQKPMDYDPQANTLGFTCLARNYKEACRFNL